MAKARRVTRSDNAPRLLAALQEECDILVHCAERGDMEDCRTVLRSIDGWLAELALIRMTKTRAKESSDA
jgi:hypothetical protein